MPKRPILEVTFVETKGGKTKVRGRMSQSPKELGEAALFIPPDSLVEARLMRYGKRCRLATLAVVQGKDSDLLEMGGRFEFLNGWDLGRARIVLSADCAWKETSFEPEDAIVITINGQRCEVPIKRGIASSEQRRTSPGLDWCQVPSGEWIDLDQLPENTTVVKGAWNHEHCVICWQCICETCGPEAWVSKDGVWVCKKCYGDYVLLKNIDFSE
jgi:hypothetical protein